MELAAKLHHLDLTGAVILDTRKPSVLRHLPPRVTTRANTNNTNISTNLIYTSRFSGPLRPSSASSSGVTTVTVDDDIESLFSETVSEEPRRGRKQQSGGASGVSSGVKLENVGKAYKGVTVLKDVSWEVKKGEKVGLVGVNGAGKTTQMRIIAGLEEPDYGNVIKAKSNMKIAFLNQEFEVSLSRTVREEFMSAFKEEMEVAGKLERVQKALEGSVNDLELMGRLLDEFDLLMINFEASSNTISNLFFVPFVLLLPTLALGDCTCDTDEAKRSDSSEMLHYKLGSIASVLVAGALGVSLPLLSRRIPTLNPKNDIFFMVKAFAAGVILATGFVHILPDAYESLTSPCLKDNPWGKFPFTGFVAMMSSIGTLMVDSFATGFYHRQHFNPSKQVPADEEIGDEHAGHIHVHTHATHGHAHGSAVSSEDAETSELIRQRIISQVLEIGIVVHSVIIGISLGTAGSIDTIKPLLVALSFHQFFEGMGLGGCISQAEFESKSTAIMATFFSLTTPIGIAIGMGVSSAYKENSPTALTVEGVFNSASAGILIYMALVDLLAADFMNPRLQKNLKLQLGANISLLLGSGCMSLLAKWA